MTKYVKGSLIMTLVIIAGELAISSFLNADMKPIACGVILGVIARIAFDFAEVS